MISLVMIVCHILVERMPERRFPKQDQPRPTLLFHGAHPALCISIQIRRPRWQGPPLDPSLIDELLKRSVYRNFKRTWATTAWTTQRGGTGAQWGVPRVSSVSSGHIWRVD